ncbi:hypothetical protein L2E82_29813 [Cichorium intybus]|uniref:Uncharacterized protein n=1 Tax=Cichorium intybus TaxID=13427 RepID=A0ACB9CYK1_CICIN|nr:hypothetical protein L2E82_29813 [Cichorium intybus]
MHLHNFNQLNSRYLVRRFMLFKSKEKFAVHFDDQNFTLDTNSPIKYPYNFNLRGTKLIFFKLIGCCNGVICFSNNVIGRDEIIDWNPSIRRKLTLIIPMYLRSEHQYLDLRFGFGYHKMSDDFKVVRFAYVHGSVSIITPHVQIYKVKTAIWREVVFPNDLPFFIFSDCSQISFAMIYSTRSSKPWWSSSSYKIWTMKDYKNMISWTMTYKVGYPENDVGRALGLRNNGDLITVESTEGDVMICNQEGWNSVYGSYSENIDSEHTFVERYHESLALLDGGDLDDEV